MKLDKNILELYWKLLPVQIFLVITNGLTNLIDGLVIGNLLSPASMIALGLTGPVIAIICSFAAIVSGGAGILCGNYMGRGEAEKVNHVYTIAMVLAAVLGVFLTVILVVFSVPLADLLGADAENLSETAAYIRGVGLGSIPMMIMPTQMTILQMCNKSNVSLYSTIIFAVFTLVSTIVSILVFHGDVFTVGLATSLSRLAVVILIVIYVRKHPELVRFDFKNFDTAILKNLILLGTPAALSNFLYGVRNIFINQYAVAVGGNVAINSIAIYSSVSVFYDATNIGIINATLMLASVFIGERDAKSLRSLVDISIVMGLLLCVIKFIASIGFGTPIAQAFGGTGDVVPMTKELLIFYALSAVPNIFTGTILANYQSLGRIKLCNIVYLFNCILSPLFCCAVLTKFFGVHAIWALYTFAEIISLTIIYIYCSSKKKAPVTCWEDILMLPEEFNTENKMSVSITSMDEVVTLAEQIQEFCVEQGVDNKTAMLSALCMEEMAGNIVDHGFTKDLKDHQIDAFVVVEDGEISMRLRDDCVPFDPHDKLKMYDDEDPTKNFGIKMVSKVAKEMNYQTNFGMNVLTIKV